MKLIASALSLIFLLVPLGGCIESLGPNEEDVGFHCFMEIQELSPGHSVLDVSNGLDSNIHTYDLYDRINRIPVVIDVAYFLVSNDSALNRTDIAIESGLFLDNCIEFGTEILARDGCNRVLYIDESLWLLDDFALELADTNIYTKPVGLVVETVFVFCDIQDNSGELVVSSSVGNASMVTYSSEITQEFYVSLEDDELIITRADFF